MLTNHSIAHWVFSMVLMQNSDKNQLMTEEAELREEIILIYYI